MKGIFLLSIFFISSASYASETTITCEFKNNFAISLSDNAVSPLSGAYKTKVLQIVGKNTSPSNRGLDGSIRATNSKTWTVLKSDPTSNLVFAGDDGDLLSISRFNKLQNNQFRSTYSSTFNNYAFTYIGVCELQK